MKKMVLAFSAAVVVVFVALAAQLLFLYTHLECGPADFAFSYTFAPKNVYKFSAEAKQKASDVLDQKFIYLGRGKQMTAFESADGRYVIKFFNPRPFVKKEWFSEWKKLRRLCNMKWVSDVYLKRKKHLTRLAKCYNMACTDLQEESGLFYLHVNDETLIDKKICVIDKEEEEVVMDLSRCPFVLQDKSMLAIEYFEKCMREQEAQKIQEGLNSLADLFVSRAKKGYTDRIQTLHNNYGFIGSKAVQIDLGKIVKTSDGSAIPIGELQRVFIQLENSINERYPEFQAYAHALFAQKLAQYKKECKVPSL